MENFIKFYYCFVGLFFLKEVMLEFFLLFFEGLNFFVFVGVILYGDVLNLNKK